MLVSWAGVVSVAREHSAVKPASWAGVVAVAREHSAAKPVLDGQDALYVASHSSRMGSCYPLGPPHMYNKLGLLREAPPPPPRTLAQQRSPNSRLSIVMSASSASPTLCAWVLSTCNQVHLAQWASSKLKLSPPNHRRLR